LHGSNGTAITAPAVHRPARTTTRARRQDEGRVPAPRIDRLCRCGVTSRLREKTLWRMLYETAARAPAEVLSLDELAARMATP